MLNVIIPTGTVNQDAIKENQHKFPHVIFEYTVHKWLESGRSISKPKWHDFELIMAFMSPKGSLIDIRLFNPILVVARPKVQFRKLFCTMQFIK